MGESDMKIVAIAVIIFITYGIFLYLNASANLKEVTAESVNSSDFNVPESNGFFDTVTEIGQMSIENPEIFFINSMLFGVIAFLLVFVVLRFARGI